MTDNGTLIRFAGVTKVYPMGEGEVQALKGKDRVSPRENWSWGLAAPARPPSST